MKTIEVTIEGVTPLLMNSPKGMLDPQPKDKSRLKNVDHVKEAEKVAYRTSKGELFIPSVAIKGCLVNASSWKKVGKFALKPIMAGAVRVNPYEVCLGTKEYEVDKRTVVIQRNRVPKARPMLKEWKAKFEIVYNETMIEPDLIRKCLEDGGERVGLLDFRPQKNGEFGCFKVLKFLPKK